MATRKAPKAVPTKAPKKKAATKQQVAKAGADKKNTPKVVKVASRPAASKVIDMAYKPKKSPFKRKDSVTWGSQVQGREKEKAGTVHSIVKANTRPTGEDLAKLQEKYTVMFNIETANTRRDDSVLVEVATGDGRKPKLYWPLTSQLRSA